MKRIIFFTSSHKIGLTGQCADQAVYFNKLQQGEFLFLSGEREQFPGLFKKLELHNVPHKIIRGLDDHGEFFRLAREFKNLADQFCPDFVTVQTNWQLAITIFARIVSDKKHAIVYIINGYRHNYPLRSVIARFLITAALYLFVDHVIAPSDFLMNKFGLLKGRIKKIYIGEEDDFFKECTLPLFEGKTRFIFGGMFRAGKNQDMLIRVLKEYVDKSGKENVELYLPGNGPLLDKCKDLARKLGLKEKVIFPGFVHRDKMRDLYLRCQFAIAPTNSETFGHCIVEPFILGRVLFTRHIGVADDIMRHGETGFFFKGEEDLPDLLLKVVPDEGLCTRVAANARQSRDHFRWENICRKYFDLIYNKPQQ